MEKILSARHFHLRQPTREFVDERLDVLASEYQKLTSGRVILDRQKGVFEAEVILHGKGVEIEARDRADDLLVAIDNAMDKAGRQLRRYLDKRQDHHAPSVAEIELLTSAREALSEA